jgi:hypothetical protein
VIARVAGAVSHARAVWATFVLTLMLETIAAADTEAAPQD